MKHLCSIREPHEANSLVNQLQGKGIPIITTNVNTHNMIKGVKMQIDLWVALESQYKDAAALLINPHHQVADPVDVDDFHKHLEDLKKRPLLPSCSGNMLMNTVVALVLVAFVGWVVMAIVTA